MVEGVWLKERREGRQTCSAAMYGGGVSDHYLISLSFSQLRTFGHCVCIN